MPTIEETKLKQVKPLPLEGLVNLEQILSVYPVSKTTLYKEIKAGDFPKQQKKGRSSYWDARAVRMFLQKHGSSIQSPQ